MLILKYSIPGIPANATFTKVDGSDNLYSSQEVPGLLVSINSLKEIDNIDNTTIMSEDVTGQTVLLNIEQLIEEKLSDDLKTFFRSILAQQFLPGQKYMMYSTEENRWIQCRYQHTLSHISRVQCGFALKSPSTDTQKAKLLECIKLIYNLDNLEQLTF